MRHAILGALPRIAFVAAADAAGLRRTDRRKPGAPFRPGNTMAVADGVARGLPRAGHGRIAGSLAKAADGACTVPCSQVCRRTNAPGPGGAARHVRKRGIRVVRAGGERALLTLNRRGTPRAASRSGAPAAAIVVHGARDAGPGPGRGQLLVVRVVGRVPQADATVLGGTGLVASAADEHRCTAHEGGIRRRRHHRASCAVAPGPGERVRVVAVAWGPESDADAPSSVPPAGAAVACGALRPGTRAVADKAYATRGTAGWCAAHGAPCVIPVRLNSSGKSRGTRGWGPHVVRNVVPRGPRRGLVRGGDVRSPALEQRAAAQEARRAEWRYGRRYAVECAIGATRRIFGGAVSARRPYSVIRELARETMIHSASCPWPRRRHHHHHPAPAPRGRRGTGTRAPPWRTRREPRGGSCRRAVPGAPDFGPFRPCALKPVSSYTTPSMPTCGKYTHARVPQQRKAPGFRRLRKKFHIVGRKPSPTDKADVVDPDGKSPDAVIAGHMPEIIDFWEV